MSLEENKKLAIEFIRRFAAGDIDYAYELLSDNAHWEIWGDLPISGIHDRAAVRALSQGIVDAFVAWPEWHIDDVIAEGNKVAVEAHSLAETKTGFSYRNKYHMLMTIEGNKISWVKEYMDTKHTADLLASAQPAQ